MNNDEKWMQVAIEQALQAEKEGEVPVGAIMINDGRLIAKAYNQPISRNDPTAHAEIQALRLAGEIQKNYRLVGSTLYVTLEPCAHTGETPPCVDSLIKAGVKKVVIATIDPDPRVAGRYHIRASFHAQLQNEQ